METKKKLSLSDIPDVDKVQNLDEAKMLINALKLAFGEVKDELASTIKELAVSREQSNSNFKKLLSITQPVEKSEQVEDDADFSKIKI